MNILGCDYYDIYNSNILGVSSRNTKIRLTTTEAFYITKKTTNSGIGVSLDKAIKIGLFFYKIMPFYGPII